MLPFDDYDFYLCGPGPFMETLYRGLRDLAVADQRIRFEAFGPASVRRIPDARPAGPASDGIAVEFARSGVVARWTPDSGSLLDLAEAEGVAVNSSCRVGACGSCAVRRVSGEVAYPKRPSAEISGDELLLCSAVPQGPSDAREHLVLEL